MNETPATPDPADGPPIPEMREAVLSSAELGLLLADLAACTEVLSVQEKGCEKTHSTRGLNVLDSLAQRLIDGTCRAAQIRYRFQDFDWTDTLLRVPDGIRLVRCQHPSVSPSPALGSKLPAKRP